MPLLEGCSKQAIDSNIRKLMSEGYEREQAVAIAMDYAREQGCNINGEGAKPDADTQ